MPERGLTQRFLNVDEGWNTPAVQLPLPVGVFVPGVPTKLASLPPQAASEAMTGSSNTLNIETLFTGFPHRSNPRQMVTWVAVLRQYALPEANNKVSPGSCGLRLVL